MFIGRSGGIMSFAMFWLELKDGESMPNDQCLTKEYTEKLIVSGSDGYKFTCLEYDDKKCCTNIKVSVGEGSLECSTENNGFPSYNCGNDMFISREKGILKLSGYTLDIKDGESISENDQCWYEDYNKKVFLTEDFKFECSEYL